MNTEWALLLCRKSGFFSGSSILKLPKTFIVVWNIVNIFQFCKGVIKKFVASKLKHVKIQSFDHLEKTLASKDAGSFIKIAHN